MSKGLFDLTNFESMDDDDIISMNINESVEDDEDIDSILEATRYDSEFQKELDAYKSLYKTYETYKNKMHKLRDDKKSAEYNQKINNMLKSKEDEVTKAHEKLIKKYGKIPSQYEDRKAYANISYYLKNYISLQHYLLYQLKTL